jgi:hypothetical protein
MTTDHPEAGRVAFVRAAPAASWHQRKADTAVRASPADSSPAAIAEKVWTMHRDRVQFRYFQTPM